MTIAAAPITRAAPAHLARLQIHGVNVEVVSDVAAGLDAVARSYASFAIPADGPPASDAARVSAHAVDGRFRLTDHRGAVSTAPTEAAVALGLLDLVVSTVLDRLGARGIVGTHAGVVAIGDRAILLAGRSGRGKSTLTLGLIRRGATWLSDEVALVAPDDRTVLPYPRSMHVSPATAALLPELAFLGTRPRHDLGGGSEWSVTPADLSAAFGTSVAGPTPLGLIVLLDGDPKPGAEPDMRPVSSAIAAMELVRGTPAAVADFAGTLRRLTGIAVRVPAVRLRTGDLDRTAQVVQERLQAR